MITFKEGIHLAEQFKLWARKYNAAPYPESVIAWLQMRDMLDEEKVHQFLRGCERPGPCLTYMHKGRGSSKSVTATELVELHRRLLDSDGFCTALDSAWQRNFMGIFEIKESKKLEYHAVDPHRDAADHWVYVLRNGFCVGNPHDSEKDAGKESASNDIHKEETIK